MITPEYLEQAADQIEKIYTDFQEWAIRDIVNRLLETDFEVSGTTQWRAEKVQQAGLVYNDLTARIAKETGKSKTEIKRLFRDAGIEVYNYGDEVYQGLGIQPLSVRQSPAMLNVLMAGMKKTEKTMKNLTGTTASMAQSQFISACDGAWMAVSSGAVSYNEAVINAVGQVGSSGMWIRYPETGHRDRLDVATRRCVLSGLGRTVGTLNEMACDELGCDLVEVTAHWNARPSHAEWQGLVYSRSGKNKDYPDFSVCGYGTGAGLLGWNCYHDFHPFFEGISERLYTEEQLAEMKNATVKYNGKEIGGYEATQVQRGIERKIRESKRKLIAYDEGIKNSSGTLRDDFRLRYSVESKQLSELNKRLDDFCSQTGFVKQYDRSRVQGFGRSQAQKAVQAGKKSLTGGGKSGMIKSQGGKIMSINNIDSPIEQRNTAKGNPNAILQAGRPLNNRQQKLLDCLTGYDSKTIVSKKSVNMKDLSAMTAYTGDEFAMFTKGNKRLIIRGDSYTVNVDEEFAKELFKRGYKWSGHTHPGMDRNCLVSSPGDILILKAFRQKTSVIYNSKCQYELFGRS